MRETSVSDRTHCLLFTGHRIDTPDRPTPRFPAASEPVARKMISDAINVEISRCPDDHFHGICSGASGGDILFLEACVEQNVSTQMYLALDEDGFTEASVADAGADWVARFKVILAAMPVHILPDDPSSELDVWQRTNLWMLDTALSLAGSNLTVIALWDGHTADGPGGTKDMVQRARAVGARIIHLNAADLI